MADYERGDRDKLIYANNAKYLTALDAQKIKWQSIAECLGMFFFVTIIGYGSSYSLFFGLYVVLVAFAPMSGAHFNPTITIGQFTSFPRNDQSNNKLILYLIAQFVGSFFAILLKYLVWGKIIAPVIPQGITPSHALFQEFFFGGWLVFVNLLVASTVTAPSKSYLVNVAIFVASLYFNIEATRDITGASLNPAIAIAGNLFGLLVEGGEKNRPPTNGAPELINNDLP